MRHEVVSHKRTKRNREEEGNDIEGAEGGDESG